MLFPSVSGHTILAVLGKGAGSTIYKAREDESGEQVAIKCVVRKSARDERYVRQVENELLIGVRLNHPNLVRIFNLQRTRRFFVFAQLNLIMEWVAGESLSYKNDYSLQELLESFIQCARALDYMHGQGLVHGDMKPSNILVHKGGQVKIVDFGLAGPVGKPRGRIQGTLDFIAPEQMEMLPVTEQTDIYNLGASFYQMFTGKRLPTPIVEAGVPIRDRVTPVHRIRADVPRGLSQIVSACCAWKPEERIPSMAELGKHLQALQACP